MLHAYTYVFCMLYGRKGYLAMWLLDIYQNMKLWNNCLHPLDQADILTRSNKFISVGYDYSGEQHIRNHYFELNL